MPTYEFRCPDGHDFEKFYRTISGAESTAACPVCGKPAERILSAAGFAFKGSGFYLTDYGKNAHREKGSDAKPGTAGAKEAASTPSGDGGSAKSDAAPSAGSDAPKAEKAEKKAEAKPAESRPAAPSKPSASE